MQSSESNEFSSAILQKTLKIVIPSQKFRLQNTSNSLAKKIFEPISPKSPLVLLERSISKKDLSKFSLVKNISKVSTQEKIKNNNSEEKRSFIINLPKLPFGKHQSYNEQKEFSREDFLPKENEPARILRIMMKNKKRARKKQILEKYVKEKTLNEFKNESGSLFTLKHEEAYENYDVQKRKYSPKSRSLESSPNCRKIINDEWETSEKFLSNKQQNFPFLFNPRQISLNSKLILK